MESICCLISNICAMVSTAIIAITFDKWWIFLLCILLVRVPTVSCFKITPIGEEDESESEGNEDD